MVRKFDNWNIPVAFDFIASTGRTATTYLAASLGQLKGILACHEGYAGADKDADPTLPLINLDNAQAHALPQAARGVVAAKRSPDILAAALRATGAARLIDVAYYNPAIARELLLQNPEARMVGIIRDVEPFVRSATAMTGEDLLPVGWPDPQKPLTDREKFIGMGRIRPRRDSADKAAWAGWSAIRRNIWLWQETNLLLAAAQKDFGNRVCLARFETFQTNPDRFWATLATFLELEMPGGPPAPPHRSAVNAKPGGYQIGPAGTWGIEEQGALAKARQQIEESVVYAC